ncbi:MAG: vanadium-dependent haloperoxidase [Armatimonadetes bacterium]|nr:vanadium-dependent haloperoxidase [Armatimonadota bacterium]
MLRKISFLALALSIVLVGCGGGGGTSTVTQNNTRSVANQWMDTLVECIRQGGPGPTANSRAIGMVTTSMYDAWAWFDDTAVGVYSADEKFPTTAAKNDANRNKAISYAAQKTLLDLFPNQAGLINAKMVELGYDPNLTVSNLSTAEGVGQSAANNLLRVRHNDGSNQLGGYTDTTGYAPVNTVDNIVDPNRWQPMEFVYPDGSRRVPGFLTPHWGQVTPFALRTGSEYRVPAGLRYGTPEFKAQVDEIINYQANITDEQKCIAEFWADGPKSETPPGHWIVMAQTVSKNNNYGLEADIKMFFLVGNAVMDAGIAAWDSKRAHDYVRPISAVRMIYAGKTIKGWAGVGQGIQDIDGANWKPYQPDSFITPPFPELPSGHSTFSAAAAKVIREFQGSDRLEYSYLMPTGSSHYEPGITPSRSINLSYPTLTSAAEAAGMSRLYGGIHFRQGNENGLDLGDQVGERVWQKANNYFAGIR